MKLSFTKMHGAGNDFVVLDGYSRALPPLTDALVRALADRHFGIGADQLLLVEKPTVDGADFKYRIFNCDGGEVEHCGNGARCFVKFVRDHGLTDKASVRVEVKHGVITLTMQDNGEVVVDMGAPVFEPARVPFDTSGLDGRREGADTLWPLPVNGATRWISVVSMGNPHAVQIVDDAEAFPVLADGPAIERDPRFPQRVNAGFMQIVSRHEVKLRVYERGAGETLACGTGACAAVAAGIRRGQLDSPVTVHTHGGTLTISWDGARDERAPLMMAGPATTVFEGVIDLPA
ncbi:diaminopimelate epimerase [Burkholderia thailandensis]|uniref:Diaminopimelate epimerase n=1 Tax=Burkholderia thailandensis (strain ATCC 700388 / DSM 13276 / CCUG 48851 / CIP 106301 / E264) TaxID=271848 RepID=DAPF_BURTA|nr:diaminopimelate epimerase [Burkholderia thailandensis]Q2T269.1 RecName: Full=Diaminopimelate epimerase; Short=DAP epimerase; AltName: Full=PLP-independent amino acid racemase [Burkholderia thailandensis E264]ABC37078.1 diaminopimelate epimerase [Burkholderia thailandensis E264]AHI72705.1 diaminopimelate epimerase [Burkholderia thailandensis 2002721723]AHI77466.1 diaminopimelate epimerase [Burkholderia thailandensis E444]AIP26113.1 diaminopimelate epimerase [Burkholderia thailandensis E264]